MTSKDSPGQFSCLNKQRIKCRVGFEDMGAIQRHYPYGHKPPGCRRSDLRIFVPVPDRRQNGVMLQFSFEFSSGIPLLSLIESAKLHGHDPFAYLRDVLTRLLTHPYRRLDEPLPF